MSLNYRQKPVQVEVWCNSEEGRAQAKPGWVKTAAVIPDATPLEIRTPVGIFTAQNNDFIVKYASGEVRVYRPDTFGSLFETEDQAAQYEDSPREVNEQPLSGDGGARAAITGEQGLGIQEGKDHTGEGEKLENPPEDPTQNPPDAVPGQQL